jgi:murein DD-endopeptidase MepM/ murein hydrolase activator NlpD
MIGRLSVEAPEVAIDRRPAIAIGPPLDGKGWLATTACCKPYLHRDLRVAIDGVRIETAETFAVDWAKVENARLFEGNGKSAEQYHGFGADVLAVADGKVVYVHDGMPDGTPSVLMVPKSKADYGGNNVVLEIAPKVFAWYADLQHGGLRVKLGDAVKAGAPIAKPGNSGPSAGPHLHFGLLDEPDPIAGRSLPFVFDNFTLDGAVDLDASQGDRPVIRPDARQVRSAYPLYGGIQDFPERDRCHAHPPRAARQCHLRPFTERPTWNVCVLSPIPYSSFPRKRAKAGTQGGRHSGGCLEPRFRPGDGKPRKDRA